MLDDAIVRIGELPRMEIDEAQTALTEMLGGPIRIYPAANEKTPAIAEASFSGSGGRI